MNPRPEDGEVQRRLAEAERRLADLEGRRVVRAALAARAALDRPLTELAKMLGTPPRRPASHRAAAGPIDTRPAVPSAPEAIPPALERAVPPILDPAQHGPPTDAPAWRRIEDRDAFLGHAAAVGGRDVAEAAIGDLVAMRPGWLLPLWCGACFAPVLATATPGGTAGPLNLREGLICPSCRLNNRQRFIAWMLRTLVSQTDGVSPRIYLSERVTSFYAWAESTLAGRAEIIGSEYLGPGLAGGAHVDGVRHEDGARLSFASSSMDFVVTMEVLEHVPHVGETLAELARVTAPAGRALITIPFYAAEQASRSRARLTEGVVEHLLEPEYHGNPVDPEQGSLVMTDFGWDVLDQLRDAGFADAYAVAYWEPAWGHWGGRVPLAFVAEHAGAPPLETALAPALSSAG